jgi:hypothetical protein
MVLPRQHRQQQATSPAKAKTTNQTAAAANTGAALKPTDCTDDLLEGVSKAC